MKTPGFRDCRLVAVIDEKVYKHHVKVGFHPKNYSRIRSFRLILTSSGRRIWQMQLVAR